MELSASWVVISLRGSAGAESFLLSPFSSNRTIKSIGYERLRVKIIMKGTGEPGLITARRKKQKSIGHVRSFSAAEMQSPR
jgi:hypothetical protein